MYKMNTKYAIQQQTPAIDLQAPDLGTAHTDCGGTNQFQGANPYRCIIWTNSDMKSYMCFLFLLVQLYPKMIFLISFSVFYNY